MFLFFVRHLFCLLLALPCCYSFSQDIGWMSGTWKGTGIVPGSLYSTEYVRTMNVDQVVNNRFMGKLISEVRDGKGTRQDIAFTGLFEHGALAFNYGNILYTKEPPYGQWWDCRGCKSTSFIQLAGDTIWLTLTNTDCGQTCDGETKYYKLLSDFDAGIQKKILSALGDPSTIKNSKEPEKDLPDSSAKQLARAGTVIATCKVFSPEIKIMLFDNGEIDDDIVSVYHNGKKIIDRQTLGIEPIVHTVIASDSSRFHEFVLVAENLGKIPPNTAFMRIVSGEDNYELFAKTSLEENAVIKIEYAGR